MRESVQQTESKIAALDLIKTQVLAELAVTKDKEEDAWKVLEGDTNNRWILHSIRQLQSQAYWEENDFFKVFMNCFFF